MRHRTVALALLLALPLAVAVACGGDDSDGGSGKLDVVATTAVIGALAEEVGGDLVDLHVLVESGQDPHDFEPGASDRRTLDDAGLVLRHGMNLDEYLEKVTDDADKAVTVTRGIQPRGTDEGEDPHVWHNPQLAKTMVENIAEALAAADVRNADTYRANATRYNALLDETDQEVREIINAIPAANRKMVTNHDAFGYFIEHYGLLFVGAIFPVSTNEAEPSAQDLARLTDLIKREGVKAIFAESSVEPRIARQIANDTGARIVDDLYGDSLAQDGDASTAHGMLLANARKIADALR